MAIAINMGKMTIEQVAEAVKADMVLGKTLDFVGVTLVVNPKSVEFMYLGHSIAKAGISFGALNAALKKQLGPAGLEVIEANFSGAMKAAKLSVLATDGSLSQLVDSPAPSDEPSLEEPGNSKQSISAPEFPVLQMKSKKAIKSQEMGVAVVPLSQATEVLQTVKGSSSGSRYFVVALSKELKVAVRLLNKQVSIRAEGPDLSVLGDKLKEAGLKPVNGHWSVHFNPIDNASLAQRTVGAVLAALNHTFDTVALNLGDIYGKGA